MKKLFLLTMLVSCFLLGASAQQLDHFLGDVLVQLKPDANVRDLAIKLQTFQGAPTYLKVDREISPPLRIWLLHFDYATIDENHFLDEIRRQNEVDIAQFNHLLEFRETEPNDPNFGQQWQWVNTGQSGGTPDADVDADLAWDLTTGGATLTGDEIVVCVLEGCNRSHPDLEGNIWFNEAEIPNNNIDDDGNGYVDDYEGWNVNSNNDNINSEGHGTTVSGMIGAKGDNGLLVSGINWDVKIMHVDFNGVSEANSLAAYTYPLIMRRRYNQSGGTEGAFVVSTNASWGIDGGDPNSAPLWCAFYDSLGVAGILSCGATANNNVNIDVVGDLPTACPSEFMIAVTATNRNDVRTFSGYGVEQIDIGAPGEDIVNINLNGGPTTTSGTSFASPLVAGMIGLLYSAPCSSIGPMASADPAGTALMIRDAIFGGVDVIPNLIDEVKYGGRVNAFNSIELLLENCGPCPQPFGITVADVNDMMATVSWQSTDSTLSTAMRWRVIGDTVWTEQDSVMSPFLLSDLFACTEYEVQLQDACNDTLSGFTNSFAFKTDGCCEAPKDVVVSDVIDTTASVSWNFVLAANSYNLLLTSELDTQLIEGIDATVYEFAGLEPCSTYGVQLQTVCDTGTTNFGTLIVFSTSGCGTCIDASYCLANSNNSQLEWIANVAINTLDNASDSNQGYGDFTGNNATDLTTYQAFNISLTPGYDGIPFSEWFSVWIDLNQDGDFDDPDEEVFDAGGTTEATVQGTVVIPGSATPGLTRMRIIMRWNNEPGPCDANFNFGEVEDYCVNIIEGTPPDCLIPGELEATGITFTESQLSWAEIGDATGYEVRIKPTAVITWVNIVTNDNALMATNLESCTEFEFQVRSNCIGIESGWSDSYIFSTACLPPCDDIPDGLDTTEVLFLTADISWNATANAEAYRVRYKKSVDPDFTEVMTNGTQLELNNLEECTVYEFGVRALCPGDQESDYSDGMSFMTQCLIPVKEKVEALLDLALLPNPFSGALFAEITAAESTSAIFELFNARGQLIKSITGNFSEGKQRLQLTGIEDTLPSGIYFVKMQTPKGLLVRKVVSR